MINILFKIIISISTYQQGKELVHIKRKLLTYLKDNACPIKKNDDILEQTSITIPTINNNDSSKHNPSNNNNNFDILELKSNTIPPINNNYYSKNDPSNINNNVDIPEQNSTINNNKVDIPEQHSITILNKNNNHNHTSKNNPTMNNNDVDIIINIRRIIFGIIIIIDRRYCIRLLF